MARESWIPGAYPSIGNAPWVCYPALRGQCYAVEKHAGQRRLHLLMDHPDVKELLAKESQCGWRRSCHKSTERRLPPWRKGLPRSTIRGGSQIVIPQLNRAG